MSYNLKNWMIVILTILFVSIYALALIGWPKPLSDITMVTRLEPLIFLVIGHYFAGLAAEQNSVILKDEIIRQVHKADAAQHVKEQMQIDRDSLEEKTKSMRVVLQAAIRTPRLKETRQDTSGSNHIRVVKEVFAEDLTVTQLKNSIITAINILDS